MVLVAGVLLWRGRHDGSHNGGGEQAQVRASALGGAMDPTTGAPHWLGQSGVIGRRIAGVVVGEDGAPQRGATVRIASVHTVAGLAPSPSRATDEQGRFDFGAQPAASYVVTAELPKLTAALHVVDLRDVTVSPPPDQLRLVMHPCDAAIHGTVYDAAGGAIGGASISRVEGMVVTKAGVEADDDGNYELCVPLGGASVTVSADGYAPITDRVSVFGRTRHDFRLVPGSAVIGRVVRADDGAVVASAIVELQSADLRAGDVPLSSSTDAEGHFQFAAVAPGRYTITARAERLATIHPVDVITELGAPLSEVVCEVAATLTVAGRVVERGTGKPAPGRSIYLISRAASRFEMGRRHAVTQADGSFVFDHVVTGEYAPMVDRGDGKRPAPIKVDAQDVTGLVIEVDPSASISGRVLAAGKPVDGARVRGGDRAFALSDGNGQFVLRGVARGGPQDLRGVTSHRCIYEWPIDHCRGRRAQDWRRCRARSVGIDFGRGRRSARCSGGRCVSVVLAAAGPRFRIGDHGGRWNVHRASAVGRR